MEEAVTGDEQLTVIGRQLHAGDRAPDFRLDYLDLADLVVRTICLADSSGQVRLLNVVNSLASPVCQQAIKQWETLRVRLPAEACLYSVSTDPPQEQARWQETEGVLHQALSAQRGEQFGRDYGVWLNEGRQLAQAALCWIEPTASPTPSTSPIRCVSQTTQRLCKPSGKRQ